MASIKTSFLLKSMFGMIPATQKIELAEAEIQKEFKEFNEFQNSQELSDFLELEKIVTSQKFVNTLAKIKAENFSSTKEYKQEQEYLKLQKQKNIKLYYKFKSSNIYDQFLRTEQSDDLKEFVELEKMVNTSAFLTAFDKVKAECKEKKEDFKETKEYGKKQKWKDLKKSSLIKKFFKVKKSSKYENFKKLDKSDLISKYEDLEAIVHTQEFIDLKNEMNDKERYKKFDEYKKQTKYEEIKNSEKFQKYFKLKGSNKFDEIKSWNLSFYDNFDDKDLDQTKWMTNYYWGKTLLKDGYSLANDKHFITDGKNLQIKDSILSIITKRDKAQGKLWNPKFGFMPKQFDYTSGLISTGESFRQKFGIFKAKIRLNDVTPVNHAFWMLSEKMIPEIDILKLDGKKKIGMNNYWGLGTNKSISKIGASKYLNDFFIFSLEWSEDKIVWKINDVIVKEQTSGIPKTPMYIVFSSALYNEISDSILPAKMDIDWIKCYSKN
ncbi:MAG: glycoside hydrolase family 16 protein [Bacteroidetes bacterium]|jgi:hypothetical protein|nr:glycoside hydrolase family 16 protein [Bacteroidota bacterium]MBT6686517.1 glycoside hydrolase family 16 protein [Bacteroidota bacterium]MBT7144224.1 glycoside hydrolase family 16 protein [Bacteroidota bacterium]MBT7491360.1 glycoside hydrolase family 16 protein [Bacteroidota bacterium]